AEARIEFDQRKQLVWLNITGMQGSFNGSNQTFYLAQDRIPHPLPKRSETAGNRVLRTQDLIVQLDSQQNRKSANQRKQAVEAAFCLARGDFDQLHQMVKDEKVVDFVTSDQVRNLRTEYYNRFALSVSSFFF